MNKQELTKEKIGNPFQVRLAIERAAKEGYESLTEDDLFLCKWIGLYTHRHEPGYFMIRTKQPNGFVTPEQLRTVADIAEKQNQGYVDITTRQDFQLHWCHLSEVLGILDRLKSVGISTLGACGDVTRNVTGCPVAGVDREELIDASPLATKISDFFLGNLEYANLPRKYKICLTGCRTMCALPEINCVAFVACERKREGRSEVGFDLRVGGGLSTQAFFSKRIGVFVTPEQVLEVLTTTTQIWRDTPEYREKRHHARIKYLIHDWGVQKFREVLEQRLGHRLDDSPTDYQEPTDSYRDHVGVHAQQQDGLFYIGAPVLVGRITSKQMQRVAHLAETYADGTIRLTVRQNLLLLNIPEHNVEKVLSGLEEVELSINAHPIRRSVVTCTGTEFCKLAITETKARSRDIIEYLERRVHLEEPLRIHITGCPNACAQYQIGHIGMMGSKTKVNGQIVEAYDVFVGGQLGRGASFNHPVLRKIPAEECKYRLEKLLVGYKQQRRPGERFNEFCQRVGDKALVALLSHGHEPAQESDEVSLPPVPEVEGPVF